VPTPYHKGVILRGRHRNFEDQELRSQDMQQQKFQNTSIFTVVIRFGRKFKK
jgi:hypothetical protein